MGWAVITANFGDTTYAATDENGAPLIMFATDYVDDIPVGTKVGTVDIERGDNAFDRQIKPGKCSWRGTKHNKTTDGKMTSFIEKIDSAAAVLLAVAMNDAAIKWRPRYVRGTVVGINLSTKQLRVASSRKSWPGEYFAEWLPVEYMSKGAEVFDLADDVVVKMVNGQPDKVIGFFEGAKPDTPNAEDISCGQPCQGEEGCECCTDQTSDACVQFCQNNPESEVCIAIANPASVTDPSEICWPCSDLRMTVCAALGGEIDGCECYDDPGQSACSQCCDGGMSTKCIDYCVHNPDDPECKKEPVLPCQVPDDYFWPAGVSVSDRTYAVMLGTLCANPSIRSYFRSSYSDSSINPSASELAALSAEGITLRDFNYARWYIGLPVNSAYQTLRYAYTNAYTTNPVNGDYYYSSVLEWASDPALGNYIKRFRILYSFDYFTGLDSFDTYPTAFDLNGNPKYGYDQIVYGRLCDIIVSREFFESPITYGGGGTISAGLWNSNYLEFITSPSPDTKYFSANDYLQGLMPFLQSIVHFLRGDWVSVSTYLQGVDKSRFLATIGVPQWQVDDTVVGAELIESGQTKLYQTINIDGGGVGYGTWIGVAYNGKIHGSSASFVDGIGFCYDGTIENVSGPCSG